jgi:hypothetical protein
MSVEEGIKARSFWFRIPPIQLRTVDRLSIRSPIAGTVPPGASLGRS